MINAIVNRKKYTDSELNWLMLINALNTPLFIFTVVYVIQLLTRDTYPRNVYDGAVVFELMVTFGIESLEYEYAAEKEK